MSGMQDKFHRDVEKSFRAAAKHRDVVSAIKKQASENPEHLAARIIEVVPACLKKTRKEVLRRWRVDLADAEAVGDFEARSVAEWQLVQ